MVHGLRPTEWVPVMTTVALFLLVVFATDAVASRAWADLLGLFYLVASPSIYGRLKAVLSPERGWSDLPAVARQLVGHRVD